MDDSLDQTPPEVTIEPADNGFVVRHYQRGQGKDQSGRTIRRVASTEDEALGHAKSALTGGAGRQAKKRSSSSSSSTTRSLGRTTSTDEAGEQSSAPAAHPGRQPSTLRFRARRRLVRARRRG